MKKLLGSMLLAVFILNSGCTLNRPTWTEDHIFIGKGNLWEARVKNVYIERLIRKDKETYNYERTNEKQYEIKYLGNEKVKDYKYEIEYPSGSASGTCEDNEENPVIIKGSGSGTTSSERSIKDANKVIIGTGGIHLNRTDIVKVRIYWDGHTEEFELTSK